MRKCILFATAGVFLFGVGLAWAQKPITKPRQPTPIFQSARIPSGPILPLTTIGTVIATPGTVTFNANNPGSQIAGSPSATITWQLTGTSNNSVWTLKVAANAANFPGCTSVPASAVTVSCTAATCSGCGGQGSAGCAAGGPWTLPSTAPGQTVATGKEGNGSPIFTVTLGYDFLDSWTYPASPACSPLAVTYTVNAP